MSSRLFDTGSLRALFAPASVAVIGASNDENKVGGRPIAFLRKAGFAGRVLPINPKAERIQGLRASASLAAADGLIEQAIIAVAAADVLAAVRQCAERGVKAVQVYSSGFADTGNIEAQQALLHLVRGAGMRMVGPNSLGLFNVGDRFFGTFATALDGAWPETDAQGRNIGLATQSGAFGSYCYGLAQARGLRFSKFIATGNEADVDVAECIAWLAQDAATRVIIATFEGCKSGARLVEALRLAHAAGKPVLVMKAGSSEAGAQAAATHTGSLAGKDAVFDGVFRQYGAWRAHSLDELIDTAYLLCGDAEPAAVPATRTTGGPTRLGIVTTSGGIGVLMADRASDAGLALPPLQADAAARLASTVPHAVAANPLDTSTSVLANLALVADCMDCVASGTAADTVLAFLGHIGRNPVHWAQLRGALFDLVSRRPGTRFVLSMLAPPEVRAELEAQGVQLFEEPTRAVAAIRAASEVRALLARPQADGPASAPAAATATASASVPPPAATSTALLTLDEAASKRRLTAAGLLVPVERVTASAAEAEAAARALGAGPFALKIVSPDITHKTDAGGVALNVASAEVGACWHQLMAAVARHAPQARLQGILVTPILASGIDTILASAHDPVFGPIVMFGLGGIWVEVFADVVFRCAPVTPDEALRMIRQTRVAALLAGVRGAAAIDVQRVARQIAEFSRHAAAQSAAIDSIEVNPWRLLPDTSVALDAVVVARQPTAS